MQHVRPGCPQTLRPRYRYLPVESGGHRDAVRFAWSTDAAMTGSAASAADRHAWAEPDMENLSGGVYRIPLPLPMDALRAVNVYALTDSDGVDLIDSGMALA